MHISTTNTCTYVYVAACLQLSLPPSPLPPPRTLELYAPTFVCQYAMQAWPVPRYIPPPSAPTQEKWPVFKRAYRRNNERSCVLFFTILLEYQFFTEILKQVRGNVNEYEDTLVKRRAILFRWERRGVGYLAVLYVIPSRIVRVVLMVGHAMACLHLHP